VIAKHETWKPRWQAPNGSPVKNATKAPTAMRPNLLHIPPMNTSSESTDHHTVAFALVAAVVKCRVWVQKPLESFTVAQRLQTHLVITSDKLD